MSMAVELGSESAACRLERDLRRAIVELRIRPGARLSEQEIASRYGVSRQPVREALIGLAKTRLVEIYPQRGTVVARISVQKMMEARFVREAIEVAVVRRACEVFHPQHRARLDDLLERQAEAARRDDRLAFHRPDELFHMTLARGAGCELAWDAIVDIKAHMDRVCHLTLDEGSSMSTLVAQHRAIIDAIDRREPAAAEAALRSHLTEILKALPIVEARHADLFE